MSSSNLKRRSSQQPDTLSEFSFRQRLCKWFLVCFVIAFSVWQIYVYWNRPPVVQSDNLRFVQLIRTACSSQREDYIAGIEKSLEASRETISDTERKYFEKIFNLTRSKNWEAADRLAKKLEDAQLSRRR